MKPSDFASCTDLSRHSFSNGGRCASWHNVPLHTFVCLTRQRRARHKVLHKSLTMKHCFRLHFITPRQAAKAPQYEASPVFISLRRGKPFHSDMKHFAYAPYDVRKWKMRVYPFAIQRYPHYIMTYNPVLYGWIFLYLDFTQRTTGIYSKSSTR